MSSNIFLIIAVVTTGIFVIQFILSIFFGDIDADVDVDADIQSYVIAILIGLFFVFAVWFLYKKAYQLQQVNKTEKTEQLVGRECTIYFKQGDGRYTVQVSRDGAMREIDVISEASKSYQTGDKTIIMTYKEGTLYIQ